MPSTWDDDLLTLMRPTRHAPEATAVTRLRRYLSPTKPRRYLSPKKKRNDQSALKTPPHATQLPHSPPHIKRWKRQSVSSMRRNSLEPLTLEDKLRVLDLRAGYVPPAESPLRGPRADESRKSRIEARLAAEWKRRGAEFMAAVASARLAESLNSSSSLPSLALSTTKSGPGAACKPSAVPLRRPKTASHALRRSMDVSIRST